MSRTVVLAEKLLQEADPRSRHFGRHAFALLSVVIGVNFAVLAAIISSRGGDGHFLAIGEDLAVRASHCE